MSDTANAAAEQPAVESKSEEKASEAKPSDAKAKPASKEERKEAAKGSLRDYLKKRAAEDAAELEDAPAPKAKPAEKQAERGEAKPNKPAPKSESAADKVEKLADKIEDAGGDAPDQKANESDKQYELRLARTLRDLRDAKAEALKARKDAETSSAELKKLQKLLDGGKANPLTVLDHLGITYEDLTKGIVEERYKPAHKRFDVPPEILEKIERLEAADKEREAERVKSQAMAKRAADEDVVKKYLADHADDYPLASSVAWAAKQVVDTTYEHDLDPAGALAALQDLEKSLADNVAGMLGSDKATKALLKREPKLAGLLKAALGLDTPAPAKADEDEEKPKTRSLAGASTEAAGKPLSKEERKAAAIVALRERRKRQTEDDD